jgi:hypothetical protein
MDKKLYHVVRVEINSMEYLVEAKSEKAAKKLVQKYNTDFINDWHGEGFGGMRAKGYIASISEIDVTRAADAVRKSSDYKISDDMSDQTLVDEFKIKLAEQFR